MACYSAVVVPVVVIDVLPPDAGGEHASRMVRACSQALPSGNCALASDTPESTRTDSLAMISWQGAEWLGATVRVAGQDRKWVTRHLTFSDDDPVSDRWTAVGLTVATLVDELQPSVSNEGPSSVAPREPLASLPSASDRRPAPPTIDSSTDEQVRGSTPKPAILTLGLSAFIGPGWTGGGLRRGGFGTLIAALPRTVWAGMLGAGYAVSDGPTLPELGNVATQWYSLTLGVAARGLAPPVNASWLIGLELMGERAIASAGSARGADVELRPRARGQMAWPATATVGVSLGATFALPALGGADSERAQLREASIKTDLLLGLEVRL